MTVFACEGCGAALTAPVSQVALPVHAYQKWGNGVQLPVLMEAGTYAVDPDPTGPPWRPWSEIGADEAEARGVFAPVDGLSFGAPGAVVVAPGDMHGTVLIPERCVGYCCGLDGGDGPNLACAQCGRAVATRIDECSLWQAVWLDPHAVRCIAADSPVPRTVDWEALRQERQGTPPIGLLGGWSPRWEAAAGAALAHLLAASQGTPVVLPDGLVGDIFGRVLDALLPPGPPTKTVALAGPGLPARVPGPDIALVPQHPQTGKAWQPSGAAEIVPVDAEVWMHLAYDHEQLLVSVTGGLPDGVLRDDPLPLHPRRRFRPDSSVFLHALARLSAVRQPWLRGVYDHVRQHPYARPF